MQTLNFILLISAPMLVFGSENSTLNVSERRETETAEICFSTHVSGYALTDHVRNTIRNALQIYALEERIQGHKTSAMVASYKCTL
jgi:hypothetical protein